MRVAGLLAGGDEAVDVAHQVAERVGPPFLVPARQVRVAARLGAEQRGILLQDLVRLVAVADPELVLVLLPPAERRLRAADLDLQIVLVAGADLSDRERALRAVVERSRTEARSSTLMSTSSYESSPAAWNASRDRLRLLALRDHGRDVAEHVRDPQAADVLRQIAPVRPDVAERRRRAALVGLEPPGVVRVLQQPVLQVVADEEMRLADVAARDGVARLLHERVAAIVEGHGVDDAGLRRLIEQLLRLGGRHRERLVGDDVLALRDRGGVDRVVQIIRRRVVDDLDVGIVEQRLVAAVGLRAPSASAFFSADAWVLPATATTST